MRMHAIKVLRDFSNFLQGYSADTNLKVKTTYSFGCKYLVANFERMRQL